MFTLGTGFIDLISGVSGSRFLPAYSSCSVRFFPICSCTEILNSAKICIYFSSSDPPQLHGGEKSVILLICLIASALVSSAFLICLWFALSFELLVVNRNFNNNAFLLPFLPLQFCLFLHCRCLQTFVITAA